MHSCTSNIFHSLVDLYAIYLIIKLSHFKSCVFTRVLRDYFEGDKVTFTLFFGVSR